MAVKVFVSVGRTSTPEQEQHVERIFGLLRTQGLDPCCVGRTSFSSKSPLTQIRDEMKTCSGVVIIAFERLLIDSGTERRGSPDAVKLVDQKLPTVWNQIEAAMAYVQDKPLLVLVERGLRLEGLLESNYDWFVHQMALTSESVASNELLGRFTDWKRRVEELASNPSKAAAASDVEKITLGQLISSLTLKQLWGAGSAIVVFLGALITLSAKFGPQFLGH
jgi:hypothetical protein